MDWALWAGFVVASLIVGLLPGPGVTSIVGYALTSGLRTALGSVFGATAGNAVAMASSLAGVGVLLEQHAHAGQREGHGTALPAVAPKTEPSAVLKPDVRA